MATRDHGTMGQNHSGCLGDCSSSKSVEEARAKGSVFDRAHGLGLATLKCYGQDMFKDFLNRTGFSWHTEPKLWVDSKVPMDVVFRGDHPKVFTQKKYHYLYCTKSFLLMRCRVFLLTSRFQYMGKKMHKAILECRPIDSYLTRVAPHKRL